MGKRAVIVTGAARGLGHAMAEALAQAGHDVLAVDRDGLGSGVFSPGSGRLERLEIDLTGVGAPQSVVDTCIAAYGRLEGLVSCAGIGQETISPDFLTKPVSFWSIADSDWDRIFAVNVRAAFQLCRAAAVPMLEAGWGRYICVTTSLETMILPGMVPYGPSKAALEAMTAIMAKELAGRGVTANVLVPGGPAATRMMPNAPPSLQQRLVQPQAMCAPAVWLMSDEAGAVNGQRFRAVAWDSSLPGAEAARRASAPAAWSGIQGGASTVAGQR